MLYIGDFRLFYPIINDLFTVGCCMIQSRLGLWSRPCCHSTETQGPVMLVSKQCLCKISGRHCLLKIWSVCRNLKGKRPDHHHAIHNQGRCLSSVSNTVVSNHVNSDHIPSYSCLDVRNARQTTSGVYSITVATHMKHIIVIDAVDYN